MAKLSNILVNKEKELVWVIAYINRKFINLVDDELTRYDYKEVEAYIPTVRLLKKKFKGENLFEFVPLLFNYGFFKIPLKDACNPEFLMTLRYRITAIYGWVKDPIKTLSKKSNLHINNSFRDVIPKAATATDKEIAVLIEASQSMSIFCQEDLKRIGEGDFIKLEGYPFEGMPAEIIHINYKKGEVRVKLMIDSIMKEMTVSFENVFYSVYKNYDETGKESSTDEMVEKYGQNSIDYITFKRGLE